MTARSQKCLTNELRRRLHKCGVFIPMARMLWKPLTCLSFSSEVQRKYQCHHYNSSIERVNLPRSQGGRGLCRFPLDHDRAVVNVARYCICILQMIHSYPLRLNTKSGWGVQSRGGLSQKSQTDTGKPLYRTGTGEVV